MELPRPYLDALLQEGAMALLLAACEGLEPRQLLLPMNLVNRLVLTAQQAFSAQYIQVGGAVVWCLHYSGCWMADQWVW